MPRQLTPETVGIRCHALPNNLLSHLFFCISAALLPQPLRTRLVKAIIAQRRAQKAAREDTKLSSDGDGDAAESEIVQSDTPNIWKFVDGMGWVSTTSMSPPTYVPPPRLLKGDRRVMLHPPNQWSRITPEGVIRKLELGQCLMTRERSNYAAMVLAALTDLALGRHCDMISPALWRETLAALNEAPHSKMNMAPLMFSVRRSVDTWAQMKPIPEQMGESLLIAGAGLAARYSLAVSAWAVASSEAGVDRDGTAAVAPEPPLRMGASVTFPLRFSGVPDLICCAANGAEITVVRLDRTGFQISAGYDPLMPRAVEFEWKATERSELSDKSGVKNQVARPSRVRDVLAIPGVSDAPLPPPGDSSVPKQDAPLTLLDLPVDLLLVVIGFLPDHVALETLGSTCKTLESLCRLPVSVPFSLLTSGLSA